MKINGTVIVIATAVIILVAMVVALIAVVASAQERPAYLNAGPGLPPFDVTKHLVPIEELVGGGPPKDGIPSLEHPKFVSAGTANRFLDGSDKVLALDYNGVAKAYPIAILNWHEIVNDDFAGKPVAVTW